MGTVKMGARRSLRACTPSMLLAEVKDTDCGKQLNKANRKISV